MRRTRMAVILVLAGCAPGHAITNTVRPECPTVTPRADSIRFVPSASLVGVFRLVLVLASTPQARGESSASFSTLDLMLVDSAQRAESRLRSLGHAPRRELRLVGAQRDSANERKASVEVDGPLLYIGCRDCMDASPTVLQIDGADDRGFFGTWHDNQTGIGRLFDERTGKPSPDPAGYFCAWRQ
jgi:hypothetical protein